MRIAPFVAAVCLGALAFPAAAAPVQFTDFGGYHGFSGGLVKNTSEGVWVPGAFTLMGARYGIGGACIEAEFCISNGVPPTQTLHDLILFDGTGKAIGFGFRTNAFFNTYFTLDPLFEFPVPGRFEDPIPVGDGLSLIGDWLADDPMAFDGWYHEQLGSPGTIPEPATALLLALGLLALARRRAP